MHLKAKTSFNGTLENVYIKTRRAIQELRSDSCLMFSSLGNMPLQMKFCLEVGFY
jgi:hypothetical protein